MPNKALDFDGASGLVTVSDAAAIQNIFDDGGTVECWINVDSEGEGDVGVGMIMNKTNWYLQTREENGGKVKLRLLQVFTGTNGRWTTTSTEVTINTWTHIAITYNNSATTNDPIIYVNGSATTLTEQTPTETRKTDAGQDLYIGNSSGDAATLDGTIDEFRLYKDRIMAQAEVTANYNGGKGRYWPSNMNNLVAWWHMDEGTGSYIYDQTNRGNTGTITSASWVNGFDFLIQKDVPRR